MLLLYENEFNTLTVATHWLHCITMAHTSATLPLTCAEHCHRHCISSTTCPLDRYAQAKTLCNS